MSTKKRLIPARRLTSLRRSLTDLKAGLETACAHAEQDAVTTTRQFDDLGNAHDTLIGRAAVLERLFESLAASAESVDFGGTREEQFWDGLRAITEEIANASEQVKTASDGLYAAARKSDGLFDALKRGLTDAATPKGRVQ